MNRSKTCLLFFVMSLCAAPVFAGPLATEPNAYFDGSFTWHDTTAYQGYDLFNNPTALTGTIDWVVFAPGVFDTLGYTGYTSTPGEFVYAYQANETGAAPLSNVSVTLETVADNFGWFTGNGVLGAPPSASYFFPSPPSANWDFHPAGINGTTSGLIFSSPFGPQLLDGSTVDHGSVAVVIPLPSPLEPNIPEPGTMTLAFCGVAVFVAQRLHRRYRQARA